MSPSFLIQTKTIIFQSKQLLFNSDQDFEATWRLIRHSAKNKDSIQGKTLFRK